MESIRKLKIVGKKSEEINLINIRWQYDKLTYLSINDCALQDCSILKSPKLQIVVLNEVDFSGSLHYLPENNPCDSCPSCLKQVSKIRELVISKKVDLNFMSYLIGKKLTTNIKILRIKLFDFQVLEYLLRNNVMPSLEKIYCDLIGKSWQDFISDEDYLIDFADELEFLKLEVYLFGIRFSKSTVNEFISSLKELNRSIEISNNELKLRLLSNQDFKNLKSQKNKKLNGLFELIEVLEVLEQNSSLFDEEFFKKLINCNSIYFFFTSTPLPKLIEKYLQAFKNLKLLLLSHFDYRTRVDNTILDLIPKYQPFLESLSVIAWNSINFDFLLPLSRLSKLDLHVYHPMEEETYLKLLTELKSLQCMYVLFARPSILTNEELGQFKRRVLIHVTNLKINNFFFKIEIHKKGDTHFLRYIYFRGASSSKPLDSNYIDNYFKMIHYKKNTEQSVM